MNKNIFFLFFVVTSLHLFAQTDVEEAEYYRFELTDSSKLIGTIIFEDESVIQIKPTKGSEIRISKHNIVRQTIIINSTKSDIYESNIAKHKEDTVEVFEDPTRSKLLLAPTAKNLNAGSVSIGTHEFILPYVSVGITDWLSFSVSTYLLPHSKGFLLFSLQANILSYKSSDIAIGIFESFSSSLPSFNNAKWKNYFYGVYTISTSKYMFNIGLTVLPSVGDMYPIITGVEESFLFFGGEIELTNTSKIITDNWVFSKGLLISSLGLRSFTKSFSFDIGAIAIFGEYKEGAIYGSSTTEFNGLGVLLGFSFYL